MFHLTSLLLHVANALLVAAVLERVLKRRDVAIGLGLLFLLHPLNTEAVAWASGRKDVLSTFFGLLSVLSFLRWQDEDERKWLVWSDVALLLGLLAKVMVATIPAVIILLLLLLRRVDRRVLLALLPHIALSAGFIVIAIVGKTELLGQTTLLQKILMAGRSTWFYVAAYVWPAHLSVLYPYPGTISLAEPAFILTSIGTALLLASVLVFWNRARWWSVGVLLYFVTVAPTFANFSKGVDLDIYLASDRYAYIPQLGFLLIIGTLVCVLLHRRPQLTRVAGGVGVVVLLACSVMAFRQALTWRDTASLFGRVIAAQPDVSHVAHNNLGNALRRDGDLAGALSEYQHALAIHPTAHTWSNIGAALRAQGKTVEARQAFATALSLNQHSAPAHTGLALVAMDSGDTVTAEAEFRAAIAADPTYEEASINLGVLLAKLGRTNEAIDAYREALEEHPDQPQAWYNLGVLYLETNKNDQAAEALQRAVDLAPESVSTRINLGIVLARMGELDAARRQFRAILQLDPTNRAAKQALEQLGN